MKKDSDFWLSKIGCGVFFAAAIGALVLPKPYFIWAERVLFTWVIICIAYVSSMNSRKSFSELRKNAVIASVVLGGLSMLSHGSPTFDEDGYVIHEGFPTTFDSQAGAGVRTFLWIFAGSFIGVQLAEIFRKQPPD